MRENDQEAEQLRKSQSRKRRWLIVIVALPLMLLLTMLGFAFFGSSQLDQELAELRSQGLPTNAVELNAYYSVPQNVTDTTELWTAAIAAVTNAGIDQRAAAIPIVGMGPTPIPKPGQEWAELDASRNFLAELDQEMQLIRQAAAAEGMARYPVDFNAGINAILPHAQEARTLARLLTLSAHVRAHEGNASEAVNDTAAVFAVSESLRGEPLLISQLIRIATHAVGCELTADMLPFCNWNDEELTRLQSAIGRADFRAEVLRAIHGERAICLHTMDTTSGLVFRVSSKLKILELLQEATAGLDVSWQEATKRCTEIDTQMKAASGGSFSRLKYWGAILMLPALRQSVIAGTRAEARQNSLIVTIAAYRYRLKHGEFPKSLDDLRDLIPGNDSAKIQRLTDPFDGQPLKFKTDDARIIIYSVSDDLIDDSGVIDGEDPRGGDLGYSIEK